MQEIENVDLLYTNVEHSKQEREQDHLFISFHIIILMCNGPKAFPELAGKKGLAGFKRNVHFNPQYAFSTLNINKAWMFTYDLWGP